MGGFSYSDLQKWDKTGRKKTGIEQLNQVLSAVMGGAQANKAQGQADFKFQREQREGGYVPTEGGGGGLGGILAQIAGGGQGYEYSKGADYNRGAKEAYTKYMLQKMGGGVDTAPDDILNPEANKQPSFIDNLLNTLGGGENNKSPFAEYPDAYQEGGVWKVKKNGKIYRIEG